MTRFLTDTELALLPIDERNAYIDNLYANVADAVWVAGMQDVYERSFDYSPITNPVIDRDRGEWDD